MKGKRWLDLVKEEQARFSAALVPLKPMVERLEKELLGQSTKHKSFKYHDFEIKETNTLHYEFGKHSCADLDAIGSSIWYVEDDGKGAETYILKHGSWSYNNPFFVSLSKPKREVAFPISKYATVEASTARKLDDLENRLGIIPILIVSVE